MIRGFSNPAHSPRRRGRPHKRYNRPLLECVRFLREPETGKGHAVGRLQDFQALDMTAFPANLADHGVRTESFRINFGHQPVFPRPFFAPYLAGMYLSYRHTKKSSLSSTLGLNPLPSALNKIQKVNLTRQGLNSQRSERPSSKDLLDPSCTARQIGDRRSFLRLSDFRARSTSGVRCRPFLQPEMKTAHAAMGVNLGSVRIFAI